MYILYLLIIELLSITYTLVLGLIVRAFILLSLWVGCDYCLNLKEKYPGRKNTTNI